MVWSPVIDRHVFERKVRPRHAPAPKLTENDGLRALMRERGLADKERRKRPDDERASQRYRLYRNRVKSALFSAKSDFFLTSYRRSRSTTWTDIPTVPHLIWTTIDFIISSRRRALGGPAEPALRVRRLAHGRHTGGGAARSGATVTAAALEEGQPARCTELFVFAR